VFTGRRKSKSGAGAGYDLPCAGGEGIRARWLNLARGGGRRCRVRRGGGGGEETGTREGGGNGGGGGLSRFAVLMLGSTRSGWTRCVREVARRRVRGWRARRDPERGAPDTPFVCPNLNRVKTVSRARIKSVGTVPRRK
jgi:hypothetical protein